MTENERRTITLLRNSGPLSKLELARMGRFSWATAVKLVNHLIQHDIVECTGTSPRKVHKGKNAYVYGLTNRNPLAVGIDIEYETTTIVLTNLRGDILGTQRHKTPVEPDARQLRRFLDRSIRAFLRDFEPVQREVVGIGIGIPGIGIPSWLKPTSTATGLSEFLTTRFNRPVFVENNIRAYTVFEKWDKQIFSRNDFILLSIRSGVGSGIFLNGHLFSGLQGLAGEIGHFTAIPDGPQCRCGKRGCLETVINQSYLFREYQHKVLGKSRARAKPSKEEVESELPALFTRAYEKDPAAVSIIKEAAAHLGPCLSNMIMILNVPYVVVSGYFGERGDTFVDALKEEVRRTVLSKVDYTIEYFPFDQKGFTRGAALLVLKDYFVGIPTD